MYICTPSEACFLLCGGSVIRVAPLVPNKQKGNDLFDEFLEDLGKVTLSFALFLASFCLQRTCFDLYLSGLSVTVPGPLGEASGCLALPVFVRVTNSGV